MKPIELRAPIETFISISNGADPSLLSTCFTADAVVQDEGNRHQGLASITAWLEESRRKYDYVAEPFAITEQDDVVDVSVETSGNFPGSPIQLRYSFRLHEQQISSLEIHP